MRRRTVRREPVTHLVHDHGGGLAGGEVIGAEVDRYTFCAHHTAVAGCAGVAWGTWSGIDPAIGTTGDGQFRARATSLTG